MKSKLLINLKSSGGMLAPLSCGELGVDCSKTDLFVGLSFDTISATGANGAVIHYKPEKETCATVDPNKIYLCDSGAQFRYHPPTLSFNTPLSISYLPILNHSLASPPPALQFYTSFTILLTTPLTKGTAQPTQPEQSPSAPPQKNNPAPTPSS